MGTQWDGVGTQSLTVRLHAHVQTLLVATELADVARGGRDLAVPVATALVLLHVALLHRATEEPLKQNHNIHKNQPRFEV